MFKVKETIAVMGLTSISALSMAAVDLGVTSYFGYSNGPQLPEQEEFYQAYEGNNVVLHVDQSQVSLTKPGADQVVDYLDIAMGYYLSYGGKTPFPDPTFDNDAFPNKGSVALRLGPVDGFAAGLGANGKAEIFKFWFNADAFDNTPTDARTWEIGYYELGRGTHFNVFDYFRYKVNDDGLYSGFPRFITFSTIEEAGIDHSDTSNPDWQSIGVNPYIMNQRLQPFLNHNQFMAFYEPIDDPNNPGSTIGRGHILADLNDNGVIEPSSGERFGLNDAQATVLYFLRNEYGTQFMQEFFDYANANRVSKKPNSNLEAVCNLVEAGNHALQQVNGTPASNNVVGDFLIQEFNFPACLTSLPAYESFESTFNWVNTGDKDWLSRTGSTSSSATGPAQAIDGSKYLYFETSSGFAFNQGDEAVLVSPIFNPAGQRVSFDYHMFGSDIGSLHVDIQTESGWSNIWSVFGEQQFSSTQRWSKFSQDLSTYSGLVQLRIRAIANGGFRGDIAIDNVKISNKPEIRFVSFDGTWMYAEWENVSDATSYIQFAIGDSTTVGRKFQFVENSGATDRGDFVYQYYHRNGLCDAFGAGTFDLSVQVWPNSDSNRAADDSVFEGQQSITCP